MKLLEFDKTNLKDQFTINMKDNYNLSWFADRTHDIYRIFFTALADTLKYHQSKNYKRIGLSIKTDNDVFRFGAILTFRKSDEGSEDDSGNWYLEFTFNKEDMTDLDLEIDNYSDIFIRCVSLAAHDISNGRFRSVDMMYRVIDCMITTLIQYLDANADPQEETEIELKGIFIASVVVENGKKIYTCVPGEVIKQRIKDDAALS